MLFVTWTSILTEYSKTLPSCSSIITPNPAPLKLLAPPTYTYHSSDLPESMLQTFLQHSASIMLEESLKSTTMLVTT